MRFETIIYNTPLSKTIAENNEDVEAKKDFNSLIFELIYISFIVIYSSCRAMDVFFLTSVPVSAILSLLSKEAASEFSA